MPVLLSLCVAIQRRRQFGREIPGQVPVLGAPSGTHRQRRVFPSNGGRLGVGEIGTKRSEVLVRSREFLDGMPPVREAGDGDQYGLIHD